MKLPFMVMACPCCGGTLEDNEDEIICHCNQITRDEIVETIKEMGSISIIEVKTYIRDTVISNCSELNPTGKCCHSLFLKVINEAIES